MMTQYVNPIKPQDFCERASNFLLAPALVAAGRKIDVRTALKLPREDILIRVACAAFAILLFPATLLGLALQYKSVTHGKHTLPNSESFKPVALVVANPNRKEVEQQMLGDVIAACRDIGGPEPIVVEWKTYAGGRPGTFTHQTNGVLEANKLFNEYTVIFLQQATASWRLFQCFQHDGYFSSVPGEDVQKNQTFAINYHNPHSGYPSKKPWECSKSDKDPDTYVTTTFRVIPTVVWNILNTVRTSA